MKKNPMVDAIMMKKKMMAEGGAVPAKPTNKSHEEMAEHHEAEAYKYRMLAEGGSVGDDSMDEMDNEPAMPKDKPGAEGPSPEQYMAEKWGMGGSVASKIRSRKMMAEGGEVDLQGDESEGLNNLDDMNYKAGRDKTYADDSQISAQPEDSNEKGDDLSDEDDHGKAMIKQIMSKMKSSRKV